jgi:hypothetical protein
MRQFDEDGEGVNVAADPSNRAVIASLTAQLQAAYSYDRQWLAQRMARMAKGQGQQALSDGYVDHPPAPPGDGGASKDEL